MDQTQCPNCGGYRVERIKRPETFIEGLYPMLAWMLVIGWILMILLLPLYIGAKNSGKGNPRYEHGFRCQLCGYEWLQHPGETLAITNDPELMERGVVAEEKRRRAALAYDDEERRLRPR